MSEKTVKGLKLVSSLVATLIGNEKYKWKYKYKYNYVKCLTNSRLKYHMVEISHIIRIATMLETLYDKLEKKNTNTNTKYKYIKCLRNSGLKYHMVFGMVATVIRNSLRCHKCITSDQSWGRTKRPSSSWSSSFWSSSSWSSFSRSDGQDQNQEIQLGCQSFSTHSSITPPAQAKLRSASFFWILYHHYGHHDHHINQDHRDYDYHNDHIHPLRRLLKPSCAQPQLHAFDSLFKILRIHVS